MKPYAWWDLSSPSTGHTAAIHNLLFFHNDKLYLAQPLTRTNAAHGQWHWTNELQPTTFDMICQRTTWWPTRCWTKASQSQKTFSTHGTTLGYWRSFARLIGTFQRQTHCRYGKTTNDSRPCNTSCAPPQTHRLPTRWHGYHCFHDSSNDTRTGRTIPWYGRRPPQS